MERIVRLDHPCRECKKMVWCKRDQPLCPEGAILPGGRAWDEFDALDREFAKKQKREKAKLKERSRKPPVSFRFSDEVLDYFKSGGAGWQGRMHAVLKDYVQSQKGKSSG